MKFENITIIFEIISALFILVSYLFEILQSFFNYNFKEYRTKEDIVERILYEQFSYDIYENINSYLFTKTNDWNVVNNNLDNLNNDMKIDIKLDSYYDCQNIYDDELNEKICQNKIVNNYTCCRAECCSRTNDNIIFCKNYLFNSNNIPQYYTSLYYNDEEILEDPRRKFCTYFNKYSHYIYQSNLTNIKLYQYKYNYKDILLNKSSSLKILKKPYYNYNIYCGTLDYKNNNLYSNDRDLCPITGIVMKHNIFNIEDLNDNSYNSEKLIIRNILSEIKPRVYEWENILNSKTKEKFSKINIKEIDEIIDNSYGEISFVYNMQNNFISVNDLRDYISFDNELINIKQKLNLYSYQYIWFENSQELKNFTKLFDEKDHRNNTLYRIGNEIFPSIESIIIGFVLLILSFIYIIIFFLSLFDKFEFLRNKILTIFFILKQIIFISTFGEELGIYLWMTGEFEEININMDSFYKSILDKYNKRRFQLFFLLSIIFLSISEIITILSLIFSKNINKNNINENKDKNNNNDNNNNDKINNNDNNINNNESNKNINKINGSNDTINNINNESININNSSMKIINPRNNNGNRQPYNDSKDNLKSSENRNLIQSPDNKNKSNALSLKSNTKFKKK